MLRQNSAQIDSNQSKHPLPIEVPAESKSIDIQQELNKVEEIVLGSPHIPLTRRTLVDEEHLLDQLDLIRLHLPAAFQEAQAVIQQKKEILLQAEQDAEKIFLEAQQHSLKIIQEAEAKAVQILNETDIIRLAELEAKQIEQEVQQECEAARDKTRTEIDQMKLQAITEFEAIQKGADEYADKILKNMEQQLNGMLKIIHNGRQQLQPEALPQEKEQGEQRKQ